MVSIRDHCGNQERKADSMLTSASALSGLAMCHLIGFFVCGVWESVVVIWGFLFVFSQSLTV